jgi:subtilisin family serine protease
MRRLAVLLATAALALACSTAPQEAPLSESRQEALPTPTAAIPASTVATRSNPGSVSKVTITTQGVAGTEVASTTAVELITVPDLVGKGTSYAEGVLDTLGLEIYIEESPDLEGDSRVILKQTPRADSLVTPGSPVIVSVPAPRIRLPELEMSEAARGLLETTGDLKAGQAATVQARRVLREDPSTSYNPFGVIVKFSDAATEDEITTALLDIGGSRVGQPLGIDNLYLIETLASPSAAIASIRTEIAVESAGLDYVVEATQFVNDEYLDEQWGLGETPGINLPAAWDISTGSATVVVAVIDTGVDLDHPDLAANIWVNPGEIPGNGIDDDANGYIDDVNGWDFANGDNIPDDDEGHGTHVAGTIGAVANNGIGVAGIVPNVRIMPLKALNEFGSGFSSDFFLALEYALANGAEVSNNSWGGPVEDIWMGALIADAGRVGHVFVAAAGNDDSNNDITPDYPNSYPSDNIISVAAIEQSGGLASFSNYGRSSVDVAAPGRDILSTFPDGAYGWSDGTSMAAPHVTGLVALIRSIQPNLVPSAIREILIDTSAEDARLRNLVASGGIVDAASALRSIAQSLAPTTTVPLATIQPPAPPAGPTTTQSPTPPAGPTTTTTTESPRAPAAPQSLSVTWRAGYSGPTISLDWFSPTDCGTEQCNALRYRIEQQTDGGSWFAAGEVLGHQGTDRSFTNLDYAHTYYFRVTAVNGAGVGPPSNSSSVTPLTTPNAPSWLDVCHVGETGNEWIATWGTNSGGPIYNGGSPVTGFKLSWSGSQITAGSSPHQFTASSPGTVRVYTVTNYGTSPGNASDYASSYTICPGTESDPPGAPTGLTAMFVETSSGSCCRLVQFDWQTPGDDGGQPIDNYNLETCKYPWCMGTDPPWNGWDPVIGDLSDRKAFDIGDTVYAKVRAHNVAGWGPYSAPVTIVIVGPISEPQNLATGDWPDVGICWTCVPNSPGLIWEAPNSDGGSPITHYKVEVSSDNGAIWTKDPRNFKQALSVVGVGMRYVATFDSIPSSASRLYRVAAVTAEETSPWSSQTSGSTPAPSISGVSLSPMLAAVGQTVSVTWTLVDSGGVPGNNPFCNSGTYPMAVRVNYIAQNVTDPPLLNFGFDSTISDCSGVSRVSGNAFEGTYLAQFVVPSNWDNLPGDYETYVTYTYINGASATSTASGGVGGWNVASPPGPPWISKTISGQDVVFSWSEPASDLPISHYVVSKSTYADGWVWSVIDDNYVDPSRTVTIPTVWGNAVCLDVYAVSGGVAGPLASSAPGVSLRCGRPLTAPTPPTAIDASQVVGVGASVSWTAPDFSGGCAPLQYEVQWSGSGVGWGPGYNDTGSFETTQTSATSPDVSPSFVYIPDREVFYRVKATCNGSSFSDIASVTFATVPGTVYGFRASAQGYSPTEGTGWRELAWDVPSTGGSPITSYDIRYRLGSGDWVNVSDPVSGTSYTLTGLANGGSYRVEIDALNQWGAGSVSSITFSQQHVG